MLVAAFVGWAAGVYLAPVLGTTAGPAFGASATLIAALLLALLAGVVVSTVHAWLSISVRADQIISGTIINIAALGITGYLIALLSVSSPTSAGQFRQWNPPAELTTLPFVGWIFNTLFHQGPLTISLLVIVVVFQIVLFRTRWGLRTRAVGEHPRAAETVGINVIRLRYRNVLVGGILAGLGGAYLSLEGTSVFQNDMIARTRVHRPGSHDRRPLDAARSVRGGPAVRVVSRDRPIDPHRASARAAGRDPRIAAAAVLRRPALPVTIIILAGVVGRSIPPAADGQPYEREAAHLTRDERDRAAAFLDLAKGAARSRSSTTPASNASSARRAGSRSSARRPIRGGRRTGSSATSSTMTSTASRSTRTRSRSSASPPTRRWPRRSRRPARSTSSTSSGARGCARRTRGRPSPPRRAACGSSSGSSTGRRPGSRTTAGSRS